jgi:hypothetical protein
MFLVWPCWHLSLGRPIIDVDDTDVTAPHSLQVTSVSGAPDGSTILLLLHPLSRLTRPHRRAIPHHQTSGELIEEFEHVTEHRGENDTPLVSSQLLLSIERL